MQAGAGYDFMLHIVLLSPFVIDASWAANTGKTSRILWHFG
jgi:hypothetical protein